VVAMNNQLSGLIEELRIAGVLRSPEIIKAFLEIDRKDFVKSEYLSSAYENIPLPIGSGRLSLSP